MFLDSFFAGIYDSAQTKLGNHASEFDRDGLYALGAPVVRKRRGNE